MSLPWFPFNINAYVTDTMALTTEGHGAYLLLMLHYYATEKPLPDRDTTLAAICKLPLDRWKALRPDIETFFAVADGLWVHERVRDEIRNGHVKHSAKVARVAAATEAAARKAAERRSATVSVTDPKTDKTPPRTRNRTVVASNDGPVTESVKPSVTDTQEQEQYIDGGDDDAGGRATLSDIEDALTGTQPVSMGVPIDLWERNFLISDDHVPIFSQFYNDHAERGTFSRDWPTLWQVYLDAALAPPPEPKPRVRKAPPRVETNKRPEPIPGVRVLISKEAFALADTVIEAMGVRDLPVTVGMPAQLQTWMASWSPDTILLAIQKVMARRAGDPPTTMKYFENAIAREHAELSRPLPVATLAPPKEIIAHGQRTETKSLSAAADRLIAKLAVGDGGGAGHVSGESQAVARPVPQIGRR